MNILKYVGIAVAVILVIVAIAAPIGPMPGFFIGGTAAAAPANWPDTSQTDEIRLKVPGGLPRVVIIWVVEHEDELYVVGAKGSGWVDKLGNGGPVEMRLGENTYPLNATPLNQGWEPVLEAWLDKYRPGYPDIVAGFPSPEEAQGTSAVYRLERA